MKLQNKEIAIVGQIADICKHIHQRSSIFQLSLTTLTSDSMSKYYQFDRNYNGFNFDNNQTYNQFQFIKVSGQLTDEGCRFGLSLKTYQNKSYLFSAIVNTQQIAAIKDDFRILGQLFSEADWDQHLYARIFETKFNTFTLLNLFITNNKQPQLLHLGTDCIQEMYTGKGIQQRYEMGNFNSGDEKNNSLDELVKMTADWQTADPVSSYQQQIVNLGTATDWAEAKPKITQIFRQEYQRECDHLNNDNWFEIPGIKYLDLAWFMSKINQAGGPVTKEMYTKMPILQLIMKSFAQKI